MQLWNLRQANYFRFGLGHFLTDVSSTSWWREFGTEFSERAWLHTTSGVPLYEMLLLSCLLVQNILLFCSLSLVSVCLYVNCRSRFLASGNRRQDSPIWNKKPPNRLGAGPPEVQYLASSRGPSPGRASAGEDWRTAGARGAQCQVTSKRMSSKSVLQTCQVRVSYKSKCQVKVS